MRSPNQRHSDSLHQQRLTLQHFDNHTMAGRDELPPVEDEEAGVMGLTEVEPSPVEETPIEYKEKSYFPDQQRYGNGNGDGETEEINGIRRMNTLGLRLGDHGTAWWRMSALKYSTYFTLAAGYEKDMLIID